MVAQTPNGTAETSDAGRDTCCGAVAHSMTDAELAADVETLAAVGNATRYEILRLISSADGDVCVCQLEPALGVTQGAVSQALSRLYTAGLVARRKDGRWRYYSTTDEAERLLGVLDETRVIDDG